MTRRPLLILAAALTLPASITHTSPRIAGGTLEAGSPVATVNPARAHGANSGASFLRPMKGGAVPPWGDGAASRDLARSVLPASPDPAADQLAARAQTSPARSEPLAHQARSVATLGPAVVVGKASAAGLSVPTDAQLAALRWCESRGRYGINTGNGYYGAYQFDLRTWRSIGEGGRPDLAAPAVQDTAVRRLFALRGWQPWPVCGRIAAAS